jgi:hypothetical protein
MTLLIECIIGFLIGRALRAIYDDLTMPKPQWMPYISNIQAPTTAELNVGAHLIDTPGQTQD